MAHIVHPRPASGAQKFLGIVFHDGHADVDLTGDRNTREALEQHGFTIEPAERPAKRTKGRGKATVVPAANASEAATSNDDGPFAIFADADGTVIGDGKTTVTLQPDEPRSLTLDNFNTTPAIQPPALTEH